MDDQTPATTTSQTRSWFPAIDTRTFIVGWMMVSTFVIIMTLLTKGPPSGAGTELLNTLLGMYVGTGLIGAINWWVGSSKGSDDKNAIISSK